MNVKESFRNMLETLKGDGFLTAETVDHLMTEADKALSGITEEGLEELIAQAASSICDRYHDDIEQINGKLAVNESALEAEDATISKVGDAFKAFLAILPDSNVEIFNEFKNSLDEEQSAKFGEFLAGEVAGLDLESEPEGQSRELVDRTEAEAAPAPEIEPQDDFSDEMLESTANLLLSAVKPLVENCSDASVLENIRELITTSLSEAKAPKMDALMKKYQREYEKMLNDQIKAMNRQNRSFKLAGGVVGKARRMNDLDDILKRTRKQTWLAESKLRALQETLDRREAELIASEGERQELSENVVALQGQMDQLTESNTKLLAESKHNTITMKSLTESAAQAKTQSMIHEARAFLAEETANLSPKLKRHLSSEFVGKDLEYVQAHLNEAITAFSDGELQSRRRQTIHSAGRPDSAVTLVEAVNREEAGDDVSLAAAVVAGLKKR